MMTDDEDVQERQLSENCGTFEDKDGEDVDVLRRPVLSSDSCTQFKIVGNLGIIFPRLK